MKKSRCSPGGSSPGEDPPGEDPPGGSSPRAYSPRGYFPTSRGNFPTITIFRRSLFPDDGYFPRRVPARGVPSWRVPSKRIPSCKVPQRCPRWRWHLRGIEAFVSQKRKRTVAKPPLPCALRRPIDCLETTGTSFQLTG